MKRFIVLGVFVFLIFTCFNFYIGFNVGKAQRQSPQIPTPDKAANHLLPEPTPNVTSVIFEQVNSPLDCPNNNCSDGKRIFPDKISPSDNMVNRKLVKVKAVISSPATDITKPTVSFKAFDVDDPSSDSIIDPNGNSGNDNRPSGLPGTLSDDPAQAGSFSSITIPVPIGTSEVSAYLTVTMQPGNNVRIAASTNFDDIIGVTIDGTGLKDAQGNSLPTIKIKRTELLTTWRKLHIEVDSMGAVTGNKVEGTFPANKKIGNGTKTLDLSPSPSSLEPNRFENGRIKIGNKFYPIIASNPTANPPVNANTVNTVTIFNNQGTFSITAGDMFTLYDDDDMNNNDGTNLDGDTLPSPGEDVPMPDICLMQGENMPSWSNCAVQGNGDNPATNVFASAYIRPIYDIGDNNNSVSFVGNVSADTGAAVRNLFDFDQISTETDTEFWTAYLLGGYQHTIAEDEDPEIEPAGSTLGITDDNTVGSVVFMEVNGPKECPEQIIDCSIAATSVHEISHLLNTDDGDGGIIDGINLSFSPTSLAKMRTATHP
jgi:hypothetical protein